MSRQTSRLLAMLELLQTRPLITGREIADELEIGPRTVRRYIAALDDLGIPVEGQRGVGGGYRLRPGYRLPPLMLSDDEAVVVSLGLLATRRLGLDSETAATQGALDKIHRLLPTTLRRQVEALESALGFTAPPLTGAPIRSEAALQLADAIRRRRRVRLSYVSYAGERSERRVSPYGLVVHRGRWYLAAFDHDRDDLRTFRVDRCSRIELVDGEPRAQPDGFDSVAHVSRSLARVPWTWEVEVLLGLPLEDAASRLPPTLAELADEDGGTLLRMRVGSLDWMAGILAGLDCDYTIRGPEELRASMRSLAERVQTRAAANDGS